MTATNTNQKTNLTKQSESTIIKPLIQYEFVGGKYPVLILLISLLLISSVIFFSMLCTMPENAYLFTSTGISKTVYQLTSIAEISTFIISISLFIFNYLKFRGTGFKIYEDGISGSGYVKGMSNGTVDFELDFKDVNVISIKFGYVSVASNGVIFNFMITSRDFMRNLKKVMAEHNNIKKNVFKPC